MNHTFIIENLSQNYFVFEGMLKGLTKEQYMWRSAADKWCLLEIICHLYDEELYDFRTRVKHTLETPERELAPIDPTGWVKSRNYIEKDYNEMVEKFLGERKYSIEWLRTLQNPNWQNAHQHKEWGPLRADMFLSNWLAHDYMHFRQINNIKFLYLKETTGESLRYAGEW
ncbi:MAG TPA: DinB family protein [Ignavibacteria bacterium]|nr:DinB family protein [Ignavibacteria bacterium]